MLTGLGRGPQGDWYGASDSGNQTELTDRSQGFMWTGKGEIMHEAETEHRKGMQVTRVKVPMRQAQ